MTDYAPQASDEGDAASYGEAPVPFAFHFVDATGWSWGWPSAEVEHFRADEISGDAFAGDPAASVENWHQQAHPDTCAIVSQEFVLDEMGGRDFTEEELRREAIAAGIYMPGAGTPLAHVGSLLELHGVGVERVEGASLDDLRQQLAAGHKILVSVDADELRTSGSDLLRDEWLGDQDGTRGRDAQHTVHVIGLDDSDPGHPKVILNDPGSTDGRGLAVPGEKFEDCWADSGNYMVRTTGAAPDAEADPLLRPRAPVQAGYTNADGTYHWTSTNTDTESSDRGGRASLVAAHRRAPGPMSRSPEETTMAEASPSADREPSRTRLLMSAVRQTSAGRQLIPAEAAIGWPVPYRARNEAFVILPVFGRVRAADRSVWAVFAPSPA